MAEDEFIDVLLADDHVMVREGLAALVMKDPDIRVVSQCSDGIEVLKKVAELRPRVVVLDLTMPRLNGLDVCRELTRRHPQTAVLILTMHNDEQFIARSLERGASGYLLKEAAAEQLSQAVHAVARGELYLGPGISRSVVQCMSGGADDPYDRLTMREKQVLQLLAEGMSSKEIARQLHVSVKTVSAHRQKLMEKLDIHDLAGLTKYAIREGLTSLET